MLKVLVLLLILVAPAAAQLRVVKPVKKAKPSVTRLGIGVGRARSVLFLTRNTKEDNDAKGWCVNAAYGLSRIVRLSSEFTWYRPIQIQPTWHDVTAHTLEMNLNFLSTMPNARTKFYPLAGISYNVFKGHFTGVNDYLNLRSLYNPGSDVRTVWMGVNAGCGFEHFVKAISLFGEFKMRVGVSEGYNELNILDVTLNLGLRYNIKVLAPHKLFKGVRSRYLLDLESPD